MKSKTSNKMQETLYANEGLLEITSELHSSFNSVMTTLGLFWSGPVCS